MSEILIGKLIMLVGGVIAGMMFMSHIWPLGFIVLVGVTILDNKEPWVKK